MKDERLIVRTMERLGIATAYGNRTQAIDYLNRTSPASCGFVAYNPFMPARVGWENYTIYIGGEDDMLKARILEGELTKWFNVRYEQYPRTSGTHIMMNVSVRAKGHLIGAYMGGGTTEPDALNFTMPNGGTITLTRTGSPTAVTLEYTLDGGATWQTWTESGTTRTLTLNAGEKVYIRNTSDTSTGFGTSSSAFYRFSFSATTEGGGNLCSLLCKNPADAVASNDMFRRLFDGDTNITKAPDLIIDNLPQTACIFMYRNCTALVDGGDITATSVGYASMRGMYYGCTALTKLSELRTETLATDSYFQMLLNCSSLSEVRTRMTDISASNCISGWMSGAASSGDFYCPANLTIPTGISGIPSGWTRHDL